MVEHSFSEILLIHTLTYYVSTFIVFTIAVCKAVKFVCTTFFRIICPFAFTPSQYSPEQHEINLAKVQQQVRDWNANGKKTKMCTGRPGWRTISNRIPIYKDTMTRIHINMNKLIYLNSEVVCVEPLMTMGELTLELDLKGWTLPVVPELNDLTIGGLVCGAGLETSSHKYGLFHNICVSYELVLSSGEVVKCTETKNSDLFYAIPGSHGTLGFLTAVELQIIPAKKYVKLEYIPVHSLDDAISTFEAKTNLVTGNDFVEGIMYSLNKGVIMVGQMCQSANDGKVNEIEKWYKPFFYKHVESFLNKKPKSEKQQKNNNNQNFQNEGFIEYIPLRDYYHRHTKCLFWVNANFIPFGNNVIFRYLFGWVLPPRVDLIKLLCPQSAIKIFDSTHLIQDFVIPLEKLKDCLILTHQVMEVYPIWLCPAKFKNTPGGCHFVGDSDEMYVDIGIYGISKLADYDIVKSARKLELFCLENRGYQALYSDVYLTKEEFEKMFKPDLYRKMRAELNCDDAFPEVYEKVCRAARR